VEEKKKPSGVSVVNNQKLHLLRNDEEEKRHSAGEFKLNNWLFKTIEKEKTCSELGITNKELSTERIEKEKR
jgi:hypothetical protein